MTRLEDSEYQEISEQEELRVLERQRRAKRIMLVILLFLAVGLFVLAYIYVQTEGLVDPDDPFFQRSH